MGAEYEAMGVPFDRPGVRLDRLEEVVALLRAHYGDGEVAIAGEHVHAAGFEGVPVPATGMPPLMIGGGSRRVLGIAGREADIVSLNFDNASGKLGRRGFGSSTAAATAQKLGWIRDGAGGRFDELELEIGAYVTAVTDERATTIGHLAPMVGLDPEQLDDHPHALIGLGGHDLRATGATARAVRDQLRHVPDGRHRCRRAGGRAAGRDMTDHADLTAVNPLDPETLQCPYPHYARMRAEAPVIFLPAIGSYLVTRHDLVLQVLRDPRDLLVAVRRHGHAGRRP